MRSKSLVIEVVVANALVAVKKHGDPFAELRFQGRIAIDVDHLDLEGVPPRHRLQGTHHVLAKMAVAATVDRQPDRFARPFGAHSIRKGI